jgi:hypothetical protein
LEAVIRFYKVAMKNGPVLDSFLQCFLVSLISKNPVYSKIINLLQKSNSTKLKHLQDKIDSFYGGLKT